MLADRTQYAGIRAKVLFFRSMPEFASVNQESLVALAEASRVRRYDAGARLIEEGRPATHVYILLEGAAAIVRRGELVVAEAPCVTGLVPVLAGDHEGGLVIAKTPIAALQIPASTVRYLMHHDFSLVASTVRLLSRALLERRGTLPEGHDEDGAAGHGTWREHELTTTERLLQLRDTPWGRSANVEAIAELARSLKERRIPAGETLWEVGDPSDEWYRIDYGSIRCEDDRGRSTVVRSGHVLGMLDAYAGIRRSYRARAETPVIALEIALSDMLSVLEAHVPLAAQMTALLARHLL